MHCRNGVAARQASSLLLQKKVDDPEALWQRQLYDINRTREGESNTPALPLAFTWSYGVLNWWEKRNVIENMRLMTLVKALVKVLAKERLNEWDLKPDASLLEILQALGGADPFEGTELALDGIYMRTWLEHQGDVYLTGSGEYPAVRSDILDRNPVFKPDPVEVHWKLVPFLYPFTGLIPRRLIALMTAHGATEEEAGRAAANSWPHVFDHDERMGFSISSMLVESKSERDIELEISDLATGNAELSRNPGGAALDAAYVQHMFEDDKHMMEMHGLYIKWRRICYDEGFAEADAKKAESDATKRMLGLISGS